jgi:hypothetical protein
MMNLRIIFPIFATLALLGSEVSTHAQTVTIADAGLDAAIREALHKPAG